MYLSINPVEVHLDQAPFNYCYIVDDKKLSQVTITKTPARQGTDQQNTSAICAMLRPYGIWCIMAHGNAEQTFLYARGALLEFPKCECCSNNDRAKCLYELSVMIHTY